MQGNSEKRGAFCKGIPIFAGAKRSLRKNGITKK
jgi:hypothetical protein